MSMCLKCGDFFYVSDDNKFPVCRTCEGDELITAISYSDYSEYLNKHHAKKTRELVESFREQYVYNSPAFDKVWYNRRLSKTQQAESEQSTSSQVRCPQCGSANIQAVQRKWSMMTGLLTNKVDRVCLNCKHKF